MKLSSIIDKIADYLTGVDYITIDLEEGSTFALSDEAKQIINEALPPELRDLPWPPKTHNLSRLKRQERKYREAWAAVGGHVTIKLDNDLPIREMQIIAEAKRMLSQPPSPQAIDEAKRLLENQPTDED